MKTISEEMSNTGNTYQLQFLTDEADENEGLGHAGIETYKDAIYAGIARECGQNSADARASMPVRMSFDVIEIARNQLPAFDQYLKTVEICLKKARAENDEKAIDFFQNAKNVLDNPKIKVLRVADFNTKGLIGPCEKGTPFHSLVKATGVSVKESDTSGGSFGIGKNAAFAISELQTVFYSSQYETEEKQLRFIAQGKTVLVSHVDEAGQPKKSTGYWGRPGFKSVTNIEEVPEWLRRNETGTSIFSIGFHYRQNWQNKMAASLLSNFFCAIHREEMEFSLNNGELVINKGTIGKLFTREDIRQAAEENNSLESFEFAHSLYDCLTSTQTKEKIFHHAILGNISFKILVSEGRPKKLALIRNGMIITDSLEHFGDRFSRFPMSKEFIAMVELQDNSGNALIKKLENPRHDGLSAERLSDPAKRKESNKAMKELIKMIRDAIKEETTTIPDKEVTVDELTEFFADDNKREKSNDPEHDDNIETFVYAASEKPQKRQPVSSVFPYSGKTGGVKGGSTKQSTKTATSAGSDKTNNKTGADPDEDIPGTNGQQVSLNIYGVRNMLINEGGIVKRRIYFTSPLTCKSTFSIEATGLNDNEKLTVVSSNGVKIIDNNVVIDIIEGQRSSLDIQFLEDYSGPIEVFAYTLQGGAKNEN